MRVEAWPARSWKRLTTRNRLEDCMEMAKEAFTSLSPGLTHLIIHPAKDTAELRATTPRTWQARSFLRFR